MERQCRVARTNNQTIGRVVISSPFGIKSAADPNQYYPTLALGLRNITRPIPFLGILLLHSQPPGQLRKQSLENCNAQPSIRAEYCSSCWILRVYCMCVYVCEGSCMERSFLYPPLKLAPPLPMARSTSVPAKNCCYF